MRRTILLMLVALVACGPVDTVRTPEPSDEIVPWIDSAYTAPSPTPWPPGIQACSSDDLQLGTFGDLGAAAGTSYAEADIHNVSSSACALTPKSSVLYRDGVSVVQNGALETYGETVFVPAENTAGGNDQGAILRIAIPGVCPPPVADSLTISLFPGNERMDLPPGSGGPAPSPGECAERGRYVLSVERTGAEPESPLSSLTSEIRAPATVAPGSVLRFLVHITNPTAQAVALDPCPGYSEGFKAPDGGRASYLLNCSNLKEIAAGRTVIYEMYFDVPEEFGAETNPERTAILTWLMLGGGPAAGAEVQILG